VCPRALHGEDMSALLDTATIVVEIALRNLFASRWKTLIVGGIIGFGALLVVVGTSLLDAVDHAMRHSITSSIAGHIQVYSAASSDELEIMGSLYVDVPDIAPLEDFAQVRSTLLAVPNVQAVVPMGFSDAVASSDNAVDLALETLRQSVDTRASGADAEAARNYEAQKARVRQIVVVLRKEIEDAKHVSERSVTDDEARALERASSDAFWASFDKDPQAHLEFLDGRIAGLAADADLLWLRYVGTDPAVFARAFDRMQIVDGQAIPQGERGFLFSKLVYEDQVKLRAARELDHIRSAIEDRQRTIAHDPDLQRIVRENVSGVNELLLQLDASKTASFRRKLQALLRSTDADVASLLAQFFATTDRNFAERYAFFYRELAPELQLYRVKVGDMLTIKTLTRNGYMQAANVKVYGTYVFKGLEKSPQAGAISMLDLITFRELYGFVTADREKEIEAMRAAAGAVDISRDAAEAALFGQKPAAETAVALPAQHAPAREDRLNSLRGVRSQKEQRSSSYDPKQLEQGPILNAAVLVRDEGKIDETIAAIERAGKRAGLPLKAISWQKAAGIIGQFATLMRAILFSAVAIIFVVALVVINNALVMAALERVNEVGTLRAIGAQRRFILWMLVVESLVIGISSGSLGALLGGLILLVLGKVGIPAQSDVMTFFFSGPRLFPSVSLAQLGFALATVVVVSLISGLYPAWLAMRVSPREAMHSAD
jgi:ABC-type lipoprotein release transport system permease subunit